MFWKSKLHGYQIIACLLVLLVPIFSFAAPQAKDSQSKYRIKIGDKVSVKFLYHPELSESSLVIRPDGCISLQIIGDERLEGLTIDEAKSRLEKAYQEVLLRPEITVTLIEFVPQRYFVSGQVQKPGSYEIRSGNTLLQAISLAGGFTPQAHRSTVIHARPMAEKQLKLTVIDVAKIFKSGGNATELELLDGDYIFVPDSKLTKMARIVEAFRFAVPGYGLQF